MSFELAMRFQLAEYSQRLLANKMLQAIREENEFAPILFSMKMAIMEIMAAAAERRQSAIAHLDENHIQQAPTPEVRHACTFAGTSARSRRSSFSFCPSPCAQVSHTQVAMDMLPEDDGAEVNGRFLCDENEDHDEQGNTGVGAIASPANLHSPIQTEVLCINMCVLKGEVHEGFRVE